MSTRGVAYPNNSRDINVALYSPPFQSIVSLPSVGLGYDNALRKGLLAFEDDVSTDTPAEARMVVALGAPVVLAYVPTANGEAKGSTI